MIANQPRQSRPARFLSVLLLTLLLGSAARADEPEGENWPGWRGPRGDGTSRESGIPVRWSDTENVRWKLRIPGTGHSSPVVWGDCVFVTCCDEASGERVLACIDRREGDYRWKKTVLKAPLEQKHKLNSYASATPATDGQHVWVSFMDHPDMVVACYDFDGKEVWRERPGKLLSRHGFCSSPVLYKDLVILNGDQDADGFLVALEKTTGKERWRTPRPNRTRSYCTPVVFDAAGKKQLVMSGTKCVASYAPDTGKQLWIIDGPTEQYVASLVLADGLLFLTTGFPEYHLMGIRPDGEGNVTDTHVAWHHKQLDAKEASYVPSPIAHGPYFFVVADTGHCYCYEAKTGKKRWAKKLGRRHSASPVSAGGLLYFPSDEGDTYVVKAGPEFELVAKNPLGEECYGSPAVSRGEIFLRTVNHLWCIGTPEKTKK
jgi:outer membrane protein assembly factor BamB